MSRSVERNWSSQEKEYTDILHLQLLPKQMTQGILYKRIMQERALTQKFLIFTLILPLLIANHTSRWVVFTSFHRKELGRKKMNITNSSVCWHLIASSQNCEEEYTNFQQLPQQIATYLLVQSNRNLFSPCSRGQKSAIRVLVGHASQHRS